jgi:1-acyl-sn-glycerol-3-phosphate acyltransferase
LIRTAFVLVVGVVLTGILAGWLVVSSLLRLPWAGRHCEPAARFWARTLLKLSGAKIRTEGFDTIDWDRPYIVVANHQSWFDVFALAGHLPVRFRFVGKEELAGIPIFGRAWTGCGHISLARDDRSRAIEALEEAGKQVREKRLAVILFPEGTRSEDGRLQAFKKGAFVLGIQTQVPILPIGISGSRACMPKGSFRIRQGEIRIRVGEPIPVEGLRMRHRNDLLRRSRAQVLGLMEDPDGLDTPLPDSDDEDSGGGPQPIDTTHEETLR